MIQRAIRQAKMWHNDLHMRELARGTFLAFALKVGASALAFAFNVAVARLLGANDVGLYFLALSITTTGAVVGGIGLNNALLRFVGLHAAHDDWGKVKGVHAQGVRLALVASGSLSLLGFIVAPWLCSAIFQKPLLTEPLRWMSLSILPVTLLNLYSQSLKGLKQVRDAMLIQGIAVPAISLALIWPLAQIAGLQGVIWSYLVATGSVYLLAHWPWHRALRAHAELPVYFSVKKLLLSCRWLLIVALTGEAILPYAPTFLLGIWAANEEVGIFGAATRVAMLVSFLLVAVNNVIAPKFAELYAKGDKEALGRVARRSSVMLAVLATPIFLVMIFEGRWVMAMFGPGFENGALVLAILATGQIVNIVFGYSGYLLLVSGNEQTLSNVTVISAVLLVLLGVLLIPPFGGVGAAIAGSVSMMARNILSMWASYRKTEMAIW